MSANNRFPIEHVIVLMLENRSYEHMLGYLPNGHGLTGDEFTPVNPADLTSEHVQVSNRAGSKGGRPTIPSPLYSLIKRWVNRSQGMIFLSLRKK